MAEILALPWRKTFSRAALRQLSVDEKLLLFLGGQSLFWRWCNP